jgi:hypothetical protein
MTNIEVQVNIIQTAINELESKLHYKELQRSVIAGPIGDIKTAVGTLKEILAHSSSSESVARTLK